MKLRILIASGSLLLAVAAFDYATGSEVLVHLFYLAPISLVAWCCGRSSAIATAVLASLVWLTVDFADGHQYTRPLYRYWNVLMFLGSFGIFGYVLGRLKEVLADARRMTAEREAALRALDESTRNFRELQGSFQTVCAWTNLIKDGDEWVDFQEFLRRRLGVRLTHGISPEAAKRWQASIPQSAQDRSK